MATPPPGHESVHFFIPDELLQRVRAKAKAEGVTMVSVVRAALWAWVRQQSDTRRGK
jgi:hypothetical protein